MTILTEPRNALVKQFQKFFSFDGIELVFAEDSLESIADKALARETGARGLRSILEETLLDVQFELPSQTRCEEVRRDEGDDRPEPQAHARHRGGEGRGRRRAGRRVRLARVRRKIA